MTWFWIYFIFYYANLKFIMNLIKILTRQMPHLWPDARCIHWSKVKVGVLRPVQQPGSYWDRSSELPLVGLEPTEVTAYD